MIKSISIKNVASYDKEGIQITDLKKVNFIYGTNGCGKTTISNYLQQLDDPEFASSSLVWENGLSINLLVYNKNFREKNFTGNIKGVFTLGQATKEEIETIEKKKDELKSLKEDGISKNNTIENKTKEKKGLEDDFREDTWTKVYKKYEPSFKEAFAGFMKKDSFKTKILDEYSKNALPLLAYDELNEKAKTIFGKIPVSIPLIPDLNFGRLVEIEDNCVWQKKVIGKSDVDIANLIQELNLNDWVNEGRSYLRENNVCPFCQKETIDEDFRKKLDNYFDKSFVDDTKSIKDLSEEYEQLATNLLNELDILETSEKEKETTKINIQSFSAYLKTLHSQVISNKELLHNKNKEPSRDIKLISLNEQLNSIAKLISIANEEINKHNAIVNNFAKEKENLINSIWKYLVEGYKTEIQDFTNKRNGLQKGIDALSKERDELRKKYQNLDSEIKELGKNVTSVQPSVDQINKTLQSFGFHNFSIMPSVTEKNHYQIQREDGAIAKDTLSEGEITFITFLYYLQLAKGGTSEENVNDERILVIDDPISSLDSNVLFVVSALIKEIIKNIKEDIGSIKQIILLTHNVYFHKEVSFIDGRTKKCNKTHFWILRKQQNTTTVQSFLMENPIQSSYGLLWQELKSDDISSIITIQNIMRRIIESYFKLLGKYGDDDLIGKFDNKEEQEICRSLICWINDGSHGVSDDLYVELQDRTVENYKKVFRDIFILTKHEGHYNMMMGLNNELEE